MCVNLVLSVNLVPRNAIYLLKRDNFNVRLRYFPEKNDFFLHNIQHFSALMV
ncbi:hypothetical protein LguiA_022954 [Lonicera macranthoides]